MIFLFKPPKSWDYRHGNSAVSLEVDVAVVVTVVVVIITMTILLPLVQIRTL